MYHCHMATTAQLLEEARTAYHRLVTGKSPTVVVNMDSSRVEFARADAPRLQAYIRELEATLTAETAGTTRTRGPITVWI